VERLLKFCQGLHKNCKMKKSGIERKIKNFTKRWVSNADLYSQFHTPCHYISQYFMPLVSDISLTAKAHVLDAIKDLLWGYVCLHRFSAWTSQIFSIKILPTRMKIFHFIAKLWNKNRNLYQNSKLREILLEKFSYDGNI
jgi:hypothetical protein